MAPEHSQAENHSPLTKPNNLFSIKLSSQYKHISFMGTASFPLSMPQTLLKCHLFSLFIPCHIRHSKRWITPSVQNHYRSHFSLSVTNLTNTASPNPQEITPFPLSYSSFTTTDITSSPYFPLPSTLHRRPNERSLFVSTYHFQNLYTPWEGVKTSLLPDIIMRKG